MNANNKMISKSLLIGSIIVLTGSAATQTALEQGSLQQVSTKQKQVRLGINAPSSIPVHREEIYLKIREEEGEGGFYTKALNKTIN